MDMKHWIILAGIVVASPVMVACDNDGPMEDAGESVDDAADDVGDALDN